MAAALPRRRLLARALLACALALPTALAASSPAAAGENRGEGICVKAYNYADPANDLLFASTEGTGTCQFVELMIYNPGGHLSLTGDFEGSTCYGQLLSHSSGQGYIAISVSLPFSSWSTPCSQHSASTESGSVRSSGGLPFVY